MPDQPPLLTLPVPAMRLADPARPAPAGEEREAALLVPAEEDCRALWERYAMPAHIRRHSEQVGGLAHALALAARAAGEEVFPPAALAAGLLHDLGKQHSILHGGYHDQIGAAWVMRETRNGPIAQAVLFHTMWPWPDVEAMPLLSMLVMYADKRVQHEHYVSLEARFTDLMRRYGKTERSRERLRYAHTQGKVAEAALSRRLGVPVHEYIAHCGRLVQRT